MRGSAGILLTSMLITSMLCAAVFGVTAAPASASTDSAAVTEWLELELDAIAKNRVNPPRAARALALVSRGMYEASGYGRPLQRAAVAGAASVVLLHLFPGEAARIEALRAAAVAGQGPIGTIGLAVGERVGHRMVARAERDGSAAVWSGSIPVGPGLWEPTPPAFLATPLEPLAGSWRTWNIPFGSIFRPGPPPVYGSTEFLNELREVYDVWRSLTAEQKAIAEFWADGAGTVTPPGHWNRIAIDAIAGQGWDLARTARLFAALNTGQADAFIASWDVKLTYWSVRPVTAIRALIDPSWSPHIATPPFPSYASGHSTTSGAAATVLGGFLPDRAAAFAAMAEEAAVSRLYGGIHFVSDNEVGLELGRKVGEAAVAAYSGSR